MDRMLLKNPTTITRATWTRTNRMIRLAQMKCRLRADCRPPNTATSQGWLVGRGYRGFTTVLAAGAVALIAH